jgi:tetratricopeptide (TPR) repeat protein
MKPASSWALVGLLLLSSPAQSKDDAPSTVGSITQNNGLTTNGRLVVKSPSILRIVSSKPVPADPRAALEQYDKLLELSPDVAIKAEAMRRSADLRVQIADLGGEIAPAELQKAVTTYNRLLVEIPEYARNDRVLYQLARAYNLLGDADKTIDALRLMVAKYPASVRMVDAAFRAAEQLYARGRYGEAESQYRIVQSLSADTRYFEPAQYKYAWSLFKQDKYEPAIPILFSILERELPRGELGDPAAALGAVAKGKSLFASDALHIVSLSFAALGGGKAVNDYLAKSGAEPRFYALIYNALGTLLLDKHRYTDAANTYAAFIERHPNHALAPGFQARVIAAYQQGGFNDLVIGAKETYVNRYAPSAPYWQSKPPSAEALAELRKDLDDLGRHYQAKAQQTPAAETASRQADFVKAAGWYRRTLDLFPNAPQAADTSMLYADALFDGGQTAAAAQQYTLTAYGHAGYAKAPEAAYAAVQAYQRQAQESPADARQDALRRSVESSLKLADSFPQHPQIAAVLTRAAEDLFGIKDYDRGVAVATRALQFSQTMPVDLRREALGVVADSRFAQNRFPEAEAAYTELLKQMGPEVPKRKIAIEQLAASIYKQGEAARSAGDLRAAVSAFQRVGRVAPEAGIVINADYDAATALMALQDWISAETAIEAFRARYPGHALIAEADKKLALAYQKDNKPSRAGDAYMRIAQRDGELPATRRDATWLAAQLYDKAAIPMQAARAYEYYIVNFPKPAEAAQQSRRRLADIALNDVHDSERYLHWLREIINADDGAGAARADHSKLMAAQASLEIGRIDAANARVLALTLPVAKSLPKRKAATEAAIATLERAAGYGYAEITTAASYEIGNVYRDFGRALIESPRPAKLKGEEIEQYKLLLEEQANPFEEKAIAAHEANLQHLRQGLWTDSMRKSASALAELAPAKYGKHEQRENSYDSLR